MTISHSVASFATLCNLIRRMQRLCQCEGAGCHSGRGCVGGGSDVACDGAWLPAISPCDLASLEELADIFGQ